MLLEKLTGLAQAAKHGVQRGELRAVTRLDHAQAAGKILLAAIDVLDAGVEAIDAAGNNAFGGEKIVCEPAQSLGIAARELNRSAGAKRTAVDCKPEAFRGCPHRRGEDLSSARGSYAIDGTGRIHPGGDYRGTP